MNAHRTSTAVMARRVEPADSLDFFPTPPWATRAFCEHVLPQFETPAADALSPAGLLTAWDPACGEGHMALALEPYFYAVHASDIFGYGFGDVVDFLHPDAGETPFSIDWIITNPPFNLGAEFIKRALQLATRGVAMLVRMQFLEGEERYAEIFGPHRPAGVFQYSERVPMHRGRWVAINGKTASAYTWLVWTVAKAKRLDWPAPATTFDWIPKSKNALSRHDDWLTFSGCMDLPKDHAAMKLQVYREPVLTLAQVRAEQERLAAERPASIADVRAAVMERLI